MGLCGPSWEVRGDLPKELGEGQATSWHSHILSRDTQCKCQVLLGVSTQLPVDVPGRQQMVARVFGSLSPAGETQVELLTSSSSLAQPWQLQVSGM